jgi:microcystin-dependent protein
VSNILGGAGGTGPADNRPLTDQEFQLVQRLFSDPLSFPLEFKAWLVAYLESSDLTLPMNAILGLQNLLGISGAGSGTLGIFPAGIILPYGGDAAPSGSFLCNGASYSRTLEARLYNAIGTRYGSLDVNSFLVPDFQGRVPVGKGTHPDVATLGLSDNLGVANRSPIHNSVIPGNTDGSTSSSGDGFVALTDHAADAHIHPNSDPTRPNDTPAFQVVNFIIVK